MSPKIVVGVLIVLLGIFASYFSSRLGFSSVRSQTFPSPIVQSLDDDLENLAFVSDKLLEYDTICSLSLAPGLLYSSKDAFDASQYSITTYKIEQRNSLPVCNSATETTGGSWVTSCTTCFDVLSCDLENAVWLATMCNHKDFVGIGKKFRKKELHSCLRDKFIVAAGDSILRGPLLRMLSPFLSLEEMKYWPSHSFGAIKGNGLLVYWDYLAKGFLRPHEKRDEKLPKDVLRHLVDNHIHPTVWKDKEALFLIGGTSSYLHEFHGWIESCEEENFFGCPWKKKQGGKGASAVIKGEQASDRASDRASD